jgi:hypothetical protein
MTTTLLTIGALAAAPATTRSVDPVEALRWERRALVVFSSDATDQKLAKQRAILAADAEGVAERRLAVVEVVGDALSVDGQPRAIDAATLARLRDRFEVGPEQFRAVLVGLDGGEKLRRDEAVTAGLLFETIDRMPMRRAERGAAE